jgi:hypothetical protein
MVVGNRLKRHPSMPYGHPAADATIRRAEAPSRPMTSRAGGATLPSKHAEMARRSFATLNDFGTISCSNRSGTRRH